MGGLLISSFLSGSVEEEAKSWTEEEFCPVAKVLAGTSTILEQFLLMLPLASYATEKVNRKQLEGRESQRDKDKQGWTHSAALKGT